VAEIDHGAVASLPSHGERIIQYGLVVGLGGIFGFQYAMARMMGEARVDPIGALFWIHVVLALIFVGVLILTRRTFAVTPGMAVFFLLVALFVYVGQLCIELIAAHHISAGELTLIISLYPIFVLILSALFRTERLTRIRVAGIALAGLCSSAILLPSAIAGHSGLFWLAIAFMAPSSQAVGAIIMVKYWPGRLHPVQVATGNLLAGTLLMLPIAALSSQGFALDGNSADGIGAIAGFATTMASEFYIFALLTRRGGAVIASCADFVAVAAGLGFGYLLFAEVPTLWMVFAALLCVTSLKLTMMHGKSPDLA
jgi:drug/metabolite transporter (DMT)-like permease